MRKLKIRFFACVILLSMLATSGCAKSVVIEESTETLSSEMTLESTVEPTEETTVPFNQKEIVIDYYKIPDIYYSFISEDEIALYNEFVTAWLNYEPMIKFEDASQLYYVWGMIKDCFFLAYGDFDEETGGFLVTNDALYFNYKSKSKEEHDQIIHDFEERVMSFYEGIDESEEGLDLAYLIYINFNQTLEYNYELAELENFTFTNASGYTAMMRGDGVCSSFAKAYSYLLLQAGIEAFETSVPLHEWSVLKIEDKYYFADPTWDYFYDPEDYEYFCFGLDKREVDGFEEEDMVLCCNGDISLMDYVSVERDDYFK